MKRARGSRKQGKIPTTRSKPCLQAPVILVIPHLVPPPPLPPPSRDLKKEIKF
ncbi:MAG: hypothetical protein ACTSU9_11425 [Promethearchaeota archaeon]